MRNTVSTYSKSLLNSMPFGDCKVPLYFKNTTVKELTYYGLFILAVHGAHVAFTPALGYNEAYLATVIAGAVLQGNPFCIHQRNLENHYPVISALTGGVNAVLGCKVFSALSNIIGVVPGFLVETCLSAILMCNFEQGVKYVSDLIYQNNTPQSACAACGR